jgi:hypothetical protein
MSTILERDLRTLLRDINGQIAVVNRFAEAQKVEAKYMQTPNGNYVMIPLLFAKSNILLALSNLEK